jgi:hypothetical protein
VERNPIGPATLDRFEMVFVGYDEKLEEFLALRYWDDPEARRWIDLVRDYRSRCNDAKILKHFTPRASMSGVRMLRSGISWDKVVEYRITSRLSADEIVTLETR